MHKSAYINAEKFYNKYCSFNEHTTTVLDVGSYDMYGSLKPIFNNSIYIGVDISEGPNVNVVIKPHELPFKDDYFDIVISSSCFEHDSMFWLTFNEMVRVLKPNGYMYICAPSSGHYHGHPLDCWRFYKDSWIGLQNWGRKSGHNIELVESYIDLDSGEEWNDSIGIYKKNK